MVIKRVSETIAESMSPKKRLATNKVEEESKDDDDDTMDTDDTDEELPEEQEEKEAEPEPAPKKVKIDVTKEAEKELEIYDAIVKDADVKFNEKLTKVSEYLSSVFEKNVNTLQFESNFNDWMRSTVLKLLEEGPVASVEFYEFLCNALKVSPTIIESTCEKMLNFIFVRHQFNTECNLAFENFMESLAYTFEKLRRFPKLVAKFLCCVRDNVNGVAEGLGQDGTRKFMKKMLGYRSKDKTIFLLPKRFMDSYASIVSLLPSGQIIDLWKTLHHNLEEECIKKYDGENPPSMTCFLNVVVDLTVSFLCNIKVVDYSVPASTVERVVDMMDKLKNNGIAELASRLPDEYDSVFTCSFLKLCGAWGHLHQFMNVYKENPTSISTDYSTGVQQAVDLTFLFPQLSSDEWISLWASIDKNHDLTGASLMVNLIGMKLEYLALVKQQQSNEQNEFLQQNIQEIAKFLWNNQKSLILEKRTASVNSTEETIRIASAYLPQDELIEYAKTLLDNTLSSTQSVPNHESILSFYQQLSSNMKFRVAVILELLQEAVKRVGKESSVKRPVKKFLSECLNPTCKVKILQSLETNESKSSATDEDLKTAMMQSVQIINDLITSKESTSETEEQISTELIRQILSLIGHDELAQFPKELKTIAFLSFLLIFNVVIKHENAQELMDELSFILNECGRDAQGNNVLFQVKWVDFFSLIKNSMDHLSDKGLKSLCSLVLENIYMSSKIASDFGDQYVQDVNENLDLSKPEGGLMVHVLNYILEEGLGTKTRSTSVLTSHAKDLCCVILKKLSDGSIITELHGQIHSLKKNKKKSFTTPTKKSKLPSQYVSRILRCCYLLLKGKSHMNPEDMTEATVIVLPYLHFALDYLESTCKTNECDNESKLALSNCNIFLLEALKTFQDYREKLPDDFLQRIWNCTCSLGHNSENEDEKKANGELSKQILDTADEAEFQSICDSIIDKMDEGKQSAFIAHILSSLITTETADEKKKQIRRSSIESSLYRYLDLISLWQESENFMEFAVPYIQFQITLLKRRKPMGSLSTLSICMASITSLPLDKIESVDSFKTLFSLICDLLNALNVYRLDVLAFRSHVFVQCFQYLVESLVKRADQRNKLTDREIYDLRHCAHCIERICQSAKLGRDELARVSPYLIVVLLRQFERTTVYPIVKNPLSNGCYKLLDMCDDHGISHVNSMLSAGSREIFKALYEMYKKFYRYKGKV